MQTNNAKSAEFALVSVLSLPCCIFSAR